jgi:hypothetical protein
MIEMDVYFFKNQGSMLKKKMTMHIKTINHQGIGSRDKKREVAMA